MVWETGKYFHPFRWNGSNSDESCMGAGDGGGLVGVLPRVTLSPEFATLAMISRERGSSTPRSDVEEEERARPQSVLRHM